MFTNALGWLGIVLIICVAIPVLLSWAAIVLSIASIMACVILVIMVFTYVTTIIGNVYRWFMRTAGCS